MQILVIANVAPGADMKRVEALTKPEARRVWDMYLKGTVRQVWYRTDIPGAVLILESPSVTAARRAVGRLPMVKAGLLVVEVIPLEAYDALGSLFVK